ncbi:hypothetical protein Droror1_Dr00020033, partial [Drosera rotundifolia]
LTAPAFTHRRHCIPHLRPPLPCLLCRSKAASPDLAAFPFAQQAQDVGHPSSLPSTGFRPGKELEAGARAEGRALASWAGHQRRPGNDCFMSARQLSIGLSPRNSKLPKLQNNESCEVDACSKCGGCVGFVAIWSLISLVLDRGSVSWFVGMGFPSLHIVGVPDSSTCFVELLVVWFEAWYLGLRPEQPSLQSRSSGYGSGSTNNLSNRVTHSLLHLFEETTLRGSPLSPITPVALFRAVMTMQFSLEFSCGYRNILHLFVV